MNGAVSDDEFSLNPGGAAGAEASGEDENDEAAALRAALHFSVGEICSAEEGRLPMTGGAVSTLAEVVFKYTEALALDLRVFAKHGKRAVVGVDDVKCVARKDPKMVAKLASFEAARNLNAGKKKAVGRKKKDKSQTAAGAAAAPAPEREDKAAARKVGVSSAGTTPLAQSSERYEDHNKEDEGDNDPHEQQRQRQRQRQLPLPHEDTRCGGDGGGRPGSDNFVDLLDDENDEEDADALPPSRSAAEGTGGAASSEGWAPAGRDGSTRAARYYDNSDDDSDDELLL
eukprot:g6748.t2